MNVHDVFETNSISTLVSRIQCCEHAVKQLQNISGGRDIGQCKYLERPNLPEIVASELRLVEDGSNVKHNIEQIGVAISRHEKRGKALEEATTAMGQGLKRLAGLLETKEKRTADLGRLVCGVDEGVVRIASAIDVQERRLEGLERRVEALKRQENEPIWQALWELQELVVHESQSQATALKGVLSRLAGDVQQLRQEQTCLMADSEKRINAKLKPLLQRWSDTKASYIKRLDAWDNDSQTAHRREVVPVSSLSGSDGAAVAPNCISKAKSPSSLLTCQSLHTLEALEARFVGASSHIRADSPSSTVTDGTLGKLREQLQSMHSQLTDELAAAALEKDRNVSCGGSGNLAESSYREGSSERSLSRAVAPTSPVEILHSDRPFLSLVARDDKGPNRSNPIQGLSEVMVAMKSTTRTEPTVCFHSACIAEQGPMAGASLVSSEQPATSDSIISSQRPTSTADVLEAPPVSTQIWSGKLQSPSRIATKSDFPSAYPQEMIAFAPCASSLGQEESCRADCVTST